MNYKKVVNKDNPYNKMDYQGSKFKKNVTEFGEEFVLEQKTLQAYLALKEAVEKFKIKITLTSGYRLEEDQEKIIREYQEKYGDYYTKCYVAKVGYSEHHTGLCFDIALVMNGKIILENEALLKEEEMFTKIHQNLANFGLILRYPKGKEKITGYNYEPWHFRYVGINTAKIIMENNLTLEEYDKLYNKSGVLIVNKPKGLTSRDVVNKVSHIFDTKKVGHNGTLDPLAEGVLVVTINKATKINEFLTSTDKEYIATVKAGIETDTLDIEGKVLRKSAKKLTKAMLNNLFLNFPSCYLQEVPKYSAIKIDGKKLYDYARNNLEIKLPKREVLIKELELLTYNNNSFKFRTVVSKGTYIRSLIRDMGEALAIPCTMEELIRTRQGKFSLTMATALDNISVNSKLISIPEALGFPVKELEKNDFKALKNGAPLTNKYKVKDKVLFVYKNKPLAIYQVSGQKLVCSKMLLS